MNERLKALEQIARKLEPGAEERTVLAQNIFDYAEAFLENLPGAPAFFERDESGAELYNYPISKDGIDLQKILELLKQNVDSQGINTPSAGHLAYIPGGPLYHSALSDFLASIGNRFSGHWFGSPGAVRIENMLLQWMASVVGYPSGSAGNLTSGGSMANLIAIVTARESAGLQAKDFSKSVVYLTEQAHHSIAKALHIAGLWECLVRYVPMDSKFRMDARALDAIIQTDKRQGLLPWLVVAAAGTTDVGAVDPLEDIRQVVERDGLWLHVDGAYGAFFALTEEGKRILKGIEASHSLTMDPHKGLFLPYGTGAVLVRDGQKLFYAFSADANYLQDVIPSLDELAPKDLSPELTRPFRGLRLWLPLQLLGTRPFEAALEEKLLLARYFYQEVQKIKGVEVSGPPDLSIVAFRFIPPVGDTNDFNQKVIQAIQQDGRIFLSSTSLNGKFMIRLAVLGLRTHKDTIDQALDILREKVQILSEE
jgi:glutamate/tyrosine decarboxylase-like PLP-dependent enzyme